MALLALGKEQLEPYKTVGFKNGFVHEVRKTSDAFEVEHEAPQPALPLRVFRDHHSSATRDE